jgi:hypothetical protein
VPRIPNRTDPFASMPAHTSCPVHVAVR